MRLIELLVLLAVLAALLYPGLMPSLRALSAQQTLTATVSLLQSCRVLSYYGTCQVAIHGRQGALSCSGNYIYSIKLKQPLELEVQCEEGSFTSFPPTVKIGNHTVYLSRRHIRWR